MKMEAQYNKISETHWKELPWGKSAYIKTNKQTKKKKNRLSTNKWLNGATQKFGKTKTNQIRSQYMAKK